MHRRVRLLFFHSLNSLSLLFYNPLGVFVREICLTRQRIRVCDSAVPSKFREWRRSAQPHLTSSEPQFLVMCESSQSQKTLVITNWTPLAQRNPQLSVIHHVPFQFFAIHSKSSSWLWLRRPTTATVRCSATTDDGKRPGPPKQTGTTPRRRSSVVDVVFFGGHRSIGCHFCDRVANSVGQR